ARSPTHRKRRAPCRARPRPPRPRRSDSHGSPEPAGREPSRSLPLLRLVEVGVLPLERQLAPILACLPRQLLGDLDAAAEALRGPAQLELGIDLELAGDCPQRE